MTAKSDWLAGLQVGDPVVVRTWPHKRRYYVGLVSRLTKTLIVTEGGWRFRRKDGWPPGNDPWRAQWIEKPTAAQARKAKAEKPNRRSDDGR